MSQYVLVGVDRIDLNYGEIADLVESDPIMRGLAIAGAQISNIAKRNAPVDTGRLRASIRHQEGIDTEGPFTEIGTDVEYAYFVEFGTSRNRAQPYLRPALDEWVRNGGLDQIGGF